MRDVDGPHWATGAAPAARECSNHPGAVVRPDLRARSCLVRSERVGGGTGSSCSRSGGNTLGEAREPTRDCLVLVLLGLAAELREFGSVEEFGVELHRG